MTCREIYTYAIEDELHCRFCQEHLNAEVIGRWQLSIEGPIPNQNQFKGQNRFVYAKIRSQWAEVLAHAKRQKRIPAAERFRRVLFTRLVGAGRQRWDLENMIGGLKPVLDVMQQATKKRPYGTGLIVDDKPALFRGHYRQQVPEERPPKDILKIEIEELG